MSFCIELYHYFYSQVGSAMTLKSTDRPPPPSPSSPPPSPELTAVWDMDSADYECDCPGPPPEFRLPPPPRPPFLQESSGADCSEAPIPDVETCDAVPVSMLRTVETRLQGTCSRDSHILQ
jgi:hypothetical protein